MDVSLFVYWFEDLKIHEERKYFEDHPQAGGFQNWPIHGVHSMKNVSYGCELNGISPCPGEQPNSYENRSQLCAMAATFNDGWMQGEYLEQRADQLSAWLNEQHSQPWAIYAHCSYGVDRTGELVGAYYMRHMGWTFTKAMEHDNEVGSREIEYCSQLALQWECQALACSGNYSYTPEDCGNCEPFQCHPRVQNKWMWCEVELTD
eukprot:TRINITY_DN2845_c0_g1_i1.p2 TRINITY_DN2845_c0_g1~~TRINITY_DN2845_c0_g1_i1.p2  ORF type:complete len:205 (+),score=42.90 TRINITY_DN2845_c0_g1_i1:429-1043(+)